jgi:hypothetical protein
MRQGFHTVKPVFCARRTGAKKLSKTSKPGNTRAFFLAVAGR